MSRQGLERLLGCLCVWWGVVILWPGAIYGTTSTFRLLAQWGGVSEEQLGRAFLFVGLWRLWASVWGRLGVRTCASFVGLFDWLFMAGAFAYANHAVGPTFFLFEGLFVFVLAFAGYLWMHNFGDWWGQVRKRRRE